MDINALLFPLTRLPENVLQHFLRVVDLPQLVGISLLSKKCKNLVKSLNLEMDHMDVGLDYTVSIGFGNRAGYLNLSFYSENKDWQEAIYQKSLYKPPSIVLEQYYEDMEEEKHKWENQNYEMKDWIDHLQVIFHRPKFYSLEYMNGGFDVKSVFEHFKGFEKLELYAPFHHPIIQNQDYLKYSHKAPQLVVKSQLFSNGKIDPSILFQNMDCLTTGTDGVLELNDLLKCGSKNLYFHCTTIAGKTLNRFIKLWIKGSNPRMELFVIVFGELSDEDVILKNLDVQGMQPGEQRFFKSVPEKNPQSVSEGWDILRQDGTKATIMISFFPIHVEFRMYVWHPQCVADSPL